MPVKLSHSDTVSLALEPEQFNPSVRRINLLFLDSLAQSTGPYGPAGHCVQ